ncbi:MAG: hypothetical protein HFJ29_00965 [Clostridia bacterium]|nr:hypothetical protein [Clostridia bacterium]
MNNKYEVFIQLLNFNIKKYPVEKVFKDFIFLFAIDLSNKVVFNLENNKKYNEIYESYDVDEKSKMYALAGELTRIFQKEKELNDVLGEIYQIVTNRNCLRLLEDNGGIERKLQSIMKINKKLNDGKLTATNCGTGSKILAYASMLKVFKVNYKTDLQVTAIDTDIFNIFMTYIQLYFYKINAVVILVDKNTNLELMKLYTPQNEDNMEKLMAA